ncbi:hypothetical protein EDB89DRAFT_2165484 [Lactarius sanguifluus]|nr:hypothetical protein EDB89DRAFT_2165484 [Lactarius sanguifluus]
MPVNKGGSGCRDSPPDYEGPGTHLQGIYGWRRTMSDVEQLTSGGQWRERVMMGPSMIDGDGRCDGVRRRIQGRICNGSGVAEIVERERTPNFGAVKRQDVTRTHTNPLICLYLHWGGIPKSLCQWTTYRITITSSRYATSMTSGFNTTGIQRLSARSPDIQKARKEDRQDGKATETLTRHIHHSHTLSFFWERPWERLR